MSQDHNREDQYAKGWSLLALTSNPTAFGQWLRSPPVWFSGILYSFGAIFCAVILIVLFGIFVSSILQLNHMAAGSLRTQSDIATADALKNLIAATGGVPCSDRTCYLANLA